MVKKSAGILAYRRRGDTVEVLLLHLGGPLWGNKDKWHFPKGELDPGEDDMAAARREFLEEVGIELPTGELIDLGEAKQGAKTNHIWALENDVDLSKFSVTLETNVFTMEWPPRSSQRQSFPENDRAQWFTLGMAKTKVYAGLVPFIDRLAERLGIELIGPAEQQSLL